MRSGLNWKPSAWKQKGGHGGDPGLTSRAGVVNQALRFACNSAGWVVVAGVCGRGPSLSDGTSWGLRHFGRGPDYPPAARVMPHTRSRIPSRPRSPRSAGAGQGPCAICRSGRSMVRLADKAGDGGSAEDGVIN
jgi:hypothetical protein